MPPSAVNDSSRAEMASVAKWRDDIGGSITTGGSGAAFTVTSYQQFNDLNRLANQLIAFTPHTTNTGNCTLSVDGLTAKPLRTAPSIDLPAGTIIQGTPYVALYNNSDGAFYLLGFFGQPYSVPIGGMIDFTGTTVPNSSFVFPTGQEISRTTYSVYFGMVGTTYGVGDGSSTFNVIDVTGRVTAMKESSATRLTSTYFGGNSTVMGAIGGLESHTLTTPQIPSHTHTNTLTDPGHSHSVTNNPFYTNNAAGNLAGGSGAGVANVGINSNTTGITINNVAAGGGGAHNNVQPTIICNKLLRII
jgi:microcystin-dependent protein